MTPANYNNRECESVEPMLSDYLENTLSGRRMWEVEKHIAACSDCAALVHEIQATVNLLHTADQYDTGGDFMAKLHARLDGLEPEAARRPSPMVALRDWLEGARETFQGRRVPALTLGVATVVLGLLIAGNPSAIQEALPDARPAPEALSRHVALAAGNPFDDPVAAKVEADTDAPGDARTDSNGGTALF